MKITPEQGGIPSYAIKEYLEILENAGLSTHSIVIARGNDILFEKYYEPFTADFLHRLYSETKSFVALAVGFAEQDGLLSLDDCIAKYFPRECENIPDPLMGKQTIRQMLMMSTPKNSKSWFVQRTDDRVLNYFQTTTIAEPLGSKFEYDSSGSFVLGAMVERLTGMTLTEYLQKKLFSEIGIDKENVRCLKVPGGHSWSDSAMLMRPLDMVKVIRFLLDNGRVNGRQILNEKFIKEATSKQIDNSFNREQYDAFGYGYLIWCTYENTFFFNGMGCQFAFGNPEKDLIVIINGDNQGIDTAKSTIIDNFFKIVYPKVGEPLPPDLNAQAELNSYAASLKLACEKGENYSPVVEKINGKYFELEENKMGIKNIRFSFASDRGILEYENAQGQKTLTFGINENCFTIFPEEGYSRVVGSECVAGNYYKCACSAAWKTEKLLLINVQIIDEYFGRLWMTFDFDSQNVVVNMKKVAEDFLSTYSGSAKGKLLPKISDRK